MRYTVIRPRVRAVGLCLEALTAHRSRRCALAEWRLQRPGDVRAGARGIAVVALGGTAVLIAVRGRPARDERVADGTGAISMPDQLGLAAYLSAIALYLTIGALACIGGLAILQTEAVLLTVLVFLGFNVAWLLLFDDRQPSRDRASA
jgi:hypothetical protein